MIVTAKQEKYIKNRISKMTEDEIIKYTIDTHKASKLQKISNFRMFFDLKCFMFLCEKYKNNKDVLIEKFKGAVIPDYLKSTQNE
jgi:hypothetical protein